MECSVAVEQDTDDSEEHKKRGFTPPHLGGEDEILCELQVLISIAEIARDCADTGDVSSGEVFDVADCLIDVVSHVDEVGVAEVARCFDAVVDSERDLAVLHLLEHERCVCDAAEECCECLHVLCV